MSLYVCDKCDCIDNTACGGNWWTRKLNYKYNPELKDGVAWCCECLTGKWHGHFEKKKYTNADHGRVLNPPISV